MNLLQKHVNANTWRYLEFGKKTQRGLNLLSGKNGLTKSVGDIAIGVIKTAIKNDWQSINQTYGWLEVCENHIVNVWQQFIIRSDVTLILTSTFRSDCSRIKKSNNYCSWTIQIDFECGEKNRLSDGYFFRSTIEFN